MLNRILKALLSLVSPTPTLRRPAYQKKMSGHPKKNRQSQQPQGLDNHITILLMSRDAPLLLSVCLRFPIRTTLGYGRGGIMYHTQNPFF